MMSDGPAIPPEQPSSQPTSNQTNQSAIELSRSLSSRSKSSRSRLGSMYSPLERRLSNSTVLTEKKSAFARTRDFIVQRLPYLLIDKIPFEEVKTLPDSVALPLGLSIYILLGSFFVFLVYSMFSANVSTKYISLNNNNDYSETCDPLDLTVSGTFIASERGMWAGQSGFAWSEAKYRLVFSELEGTRQYEGMMDYFEKVRIA
jgi:hypothetical protein